MFATLGRFIYRFRWPVILIWILIFAWSAVFTAVVPSAFRAGGFTSDLESVRAGKTLTKELDRSRTSVVAIFSHDSLTVDVPAFKQAMEKALGDIQRLPSVKEITSYYSSGRAQLVAANRRTTYASIGLDVDPDNPGSILDELRLVRAEPLNVIVSGDIVVYADIDEVAHRDLVRAETITFPVVLLILVIVFGTAIAAGLPVALGAASVTTTLAVLYFLSYRMDISIFAMNLSSMLGLGLGIDYSLLLISRFREELARDGNMRRSVETTVGTAGKAVFFSGLIVFIGLGGMLTFPFMALNSLAYGGMIVVSLSMLAALTLVPAVLSILGPWVNRLGIRRIGAMRPGGLWRRLAVAVMRHPIAIFVAVLAVVLLLSSPLLRIRLGTPDASILPADVASRRGADILKSEFGAGEISPILVVLRSESDVMSPNNVGASFDLTKKLEGDGRVKRVDGLFNLDPRLNREQLMGLYGGPRPIAVPALAQAVDRLGSKHATFLSVVSKHPPMSDETRDLVEELRAMKLGGDLYTEVGGLTATAIDMESALYADFPKAIAIVVAATFIVLLVLFRSVVLPLKAVVMNTISIAASYGALVFIFQEGNLSNILGFTPQGHIDSTVPIMLFSILFGLSMDYEVFLLTRVKEAYDRTGSNEQAIVEGLERTGRIITSAAAVMVAVTGSFGATDLVVIKAMGIGAAIAIMLDATIVRALLVPATMRLLGDWNWWAPRFIRERRGLLVD